MPFIGTLLRKLLRGSRLLSTPPGVLRVNRIRRIALATGSAEDFTLPLAARCTRHVGW